MSVSERLQTQKFNFQIVTAMGTYSYTVRVDNIYSSNTVYVETIETPQGKFIEDIPLPEEVIRDMYSSIDSVLGENIPTISMNLSALTFEATATGPDTDTQEIVLTNTGDFGSLLSITLESDVSWLSIVPDSAGNIAKDETESILVSALTATLNAGTHTGTISILDSRASNSPQSVGVTFTVLPQPEIQVLPSTTLDFSAIENGSNPPTQIINISNSGPDDSILNWTAQVVNNSSWLSVNPNSGGPLTNLDSPIPISVLVNAAGMLAGTYIDIVRISDSVASNTPVDIEVTLTVVGV